MKLKTFLLMARRSERLAQARARGDAFPVFTPREWADMPVFHPRAS